MHHPFLSKLNADSGHIDAVPEVRQKKEKTWTTTNTLTQLSPDDSLELAHNRRKQKKETERRMQHVVLKIK